MNSQIQGTYVVTGGGSGSGRAVARRLSRLGATVIIWGRNREKLAETVTAKEATAYFVVDVGVPDSIDNAFGEVAGRYGHLNGFVHCAGIWTPGKLADIDEKTLHEHIVTVAVGSALSIRGAVRALGAEGGRIVQIAAASAKAGFEETALNTLAKRAQDGLHEGLVRELKGSHIRLTTIYPDNISPLGSDRVRSGKAMSYDDVADAVIWALSASDTVWVQEILMTSPNNPR